MDAHDSDHTARNTWITILAIVGFIVVILVLVSACDNGTTDYCPDDDYVSDPSYDDDVCEGDSHSGGGFFFFGIGGGGSNSGGSGSDFRGGGSGFGK
ncbi:hypothetical protein BJF83_06875 [Nocardiopsis sp. CNR-923]|uniref:hypothetical protein n=1 Tax=Nocardiopsis sp. CNR-923 TaxID=1904965 RepID=UPI00095A0DA6|nr:hypothetical protein [Nocardiopsis sp. CNR-923]OLT24204.1 hypothetical protein BJF83_06875 [Nocardiopsis sp. CNR-923]